MKKLLTLLGSFGLVAGTAATVVACGKGDTTTQDNGTTPPVETNEDATVKIGAEGHIDIVADLIKGFDVATLTVEETTEIKLLDELKLDNKEAPTKINFKGKAEGTATIKLSGTKKVEAPASGAKDDTATPPTLETIKEFTVKVEKDEAPKATPISEKITTLALGEIANKDSATILTAINTANKGADLTDADVTITVLEGDKSATVTGKGKYEGSVTVTFTLKETTA